jgi:Family of unknown function (DUF5906)/Bifunctional DNA primase/polymerase, N-terminal
MSTACDIALRLQLLQAGYSPIPLYGKEPPIYGRNNSKKGLAGWQNLNGVTREQIEMWGRTWPDAHNTGILTRLMPTLDADILNEEAARAVEDHVREFHEERGYVLVRTGKAPKRAIPFRTDEPFEKIVANLVAPSGSTEKIEFLADGQQVACFGIHPDTGKAYGWHGGEPGQIARGDLPYIRGKEARHLVDGIVELLVRDFHYAHAPGRPKNQRKSSSANHGTDRGGGAADWQWLLDNIREGRELHDSLRDLAAKMVKSGMSAGAVVNQLRALMEGSTTPHDKRWRERYSEIPRLVDSAEAFREIRDTQPGEGTAEQREVRLEDFVAYMPMHSYIFTPTREMWPASSVNARIKPILQETGKAVSASAWLDVGAPVEQMTWAPGLPMLIKGRLVSEGGWIERPGCTVFNLYRPPAIVPCNAAGAIPWLDHVHRVYPDEADHIVRWLAHRVQRPQEKINHALVLGGLQGIGKDTLIEPAKRAVGPWNVFEVSPQHLLGRFNGFVKSVILRVNEARDLGDVDRFSFYDHMKAYTAAPPDVLRVDEKNLREYSVLNCCGVIITTNHKADGIYLPADDRRHFVAWSDLTKDDFTADYWTRIWSWYDRGGDRRVAAYLLELDISAFDAKAPPPKTTAFWDIVDAGRATEDAELADVLDRLGSPAVTTLARVQNEATNDFEIWIRDRRNRRQIPHRFEQCGYVPVRNDAADSGLWVINRTRQVVYAKASLSVRDRLAAARELAQGASGEQSMQ